MTDNRTVRCPKCGQFLGQETTVSGEPVLLINGFWIKELDLQCASCWFSFSWRPLEV